MKVYIFEISMDWYATWHFEKVNFFVFTRIHKWSMRIIVFDPPYDGWHFFFKLDHLTKTEGGPAVIWQKWPYCFHHTTKGRIQRCFDAMFILSVFIRFQLFWWGGSWNWWMWTKGFCFLQCLSYKELWRFRPTNSSITTFYSSSHGSLNFQLFCNLFVTVYTKQGRKGKCSDDVTKSDRMTDGKTHLQAA